MIYRWGTVVDSFIKSLSLLVMEIAFGEEVMFVIYFIFIAVLAFPQYVALTLSNLPVSILRVWLLILSLVISFRLLKS
jgi:hypothetical protein